MPKADSSTAKIGGLTARRIEFDVGQTRHGQAVRLVREIRDGVPDWQLIRDAANQRDEGATVTGLTPEIIANMAKATRAVE